MEVLNKTAHAGWVAADIALENALFSALFWVIPALFCGFCKVFTVRPVAFSAANVKLARNSTLRTNHTVRTNKLFIVFEAAFTSASPRRSVADGKKSPHGETRQQV